MREYKRLALRMVALAPDNMKYRMEEQYADADLGAVLSDQRRFAEAAGQFQEALNTMQAIATADPSNTDYQKSVAESLAWLGDARKAVGEYDAAIAARERGVRILETLYRKTGNVDFRQRLIPAHRSLGNFYEETGRSATAMQQYRTAIAHADALTNVEPDNAVWLEYGYQARFDLAGQLMADGQLAEASSLTGAACQTVSRLLKRDGRAPTWQKGLITCWLTQGGLALKSGAKAQARELALRSVAAARSLRTGDAVSDGFFAAKSYLLLGDSERELGDLRAAQTAWSQALAAIPAGTTERPDEIASHAKILLRLGRQAEAAPMLARLRAMGFRELSA